MQALIFKSFQQFFHMQIFNAWGGTWKSRTHTMLINNQESHEPSLVPLIKFSDIFVPHNHLNVVAEFKGRML